MPNRSVRLGRWLRWPVWLAISGRPTPGFGRHVEAARRRWPGQSGHVGPRRSFTCPALAHSLSALSLPSLAFSFALASASAAQRSATVVLPTT